MISAEVIADSICQGSRITTLQLKYPRFIHSEFMTHRMFSRNASSSRAIPVKKELERVRTEPALPAYIGKNKPGMQADEEIDDDTKQLILLHLKLLAQKVADEVETINRMYGIHKQVLNRYLEPWQHINVVVTATDWDNFFDLRDNDAAEPHIHELARKIREAMEASTPQELSTGDWHQPYWTDDLKLIDPVRRCHICAARCARVSYRNHDGEFDLAKDLKLASRLYKNGHWSPFEHVARARPNTGYYANFRGWQSLRHQLALT